MKFNARLTLSHKDTCLLLVAPYRVKGMQLKTATNLAYLIENDMKQYFPCNIRNYQSFENHLHSQVPHQQREYFLSECQE